MNGIHLIKQDARGVTTQFYALLITALLELHLKQQVLEQVEGKSTLHLNPDETHPLLENELQNSNETSKSNCTGEKSITEANQNLSVNDSNLSEETGQGEQLQSLISPLAKNEESIKGASGNPSVNACSNILKTNPELAEPSTNGGEKIVSSGHEFVEMIGKDVKKYWKIGIHWLTALRNLLASPFDDRAIEILANTS
jgi:hypothetical protein